MRYVLILVSLIFTSHIQAQIPTPDNPNYIDVPVQSGMGLGEVVRKVDRDPDWGRTDWLQAIQKANPDNVTADFKIVNPNSTIKVPQEALVNLNYLPGKEPVATAPVVKAPEPVVEPVPAAPAPTPVPAPPQPKKIAKAKPASKHHFSFQLLAAFETLEAENTVNTELELKPETGYGIDLEYLWAMYGQTGLRVGARWLNLEYKDPSTVTVVHDDQNLYGGHLGWQMGVSEAFSGYFDLVARSQNEVELAVGTSTIEPISVTLGRVGVNYAFFRRPNYKMNFDIAYESVMSSDDGNGLTVGLDYRRTKGLGLGVEYNLRDLDTDQADHQYELVLGQIIYDF